MVCSYHARFNVTDMHTDGLAKRNSREAPSLIAVSKLLVATVKSMI